MNKLRGYHCNMCGAWLLLGENHTCEKEKLDIIDRIASFLGQPHDKDLDSKEINLKLFPFDDSRKKETKE